MDSIDVRIDLISFHVPDVTKFILNGLNEATPLK